MTERKTIYKWFWAWEFDKEERWLNIMAQSGWLLDKVSFCIYHFIACTPGEYAVRLEMHSYDEAYIRFMKETGAEYIGRVFLWVFFRKKVLDGSFDIFSDMDSKIAHLDKIGRLLTIIGVMNLGVGLANTINAPHLGWINLLCATLLMYGLGRIHGKKEALQEKRELSE